MKKLLFSLCLAFPFTVSNVFAQGTEPANAEEVFLRLKKLNVLGAVLYVAAHPDDENSRLIAYLAKDRLYRTGYLSMTRGDGGQNMIGDEQGVELGLIRTQEMLAARRIDGAEQFFTRAFDFGYTKTTEEALSTWDKEKILSDVVWVIRRFQPDILITRFPENFKTSYHGQHAAATALAREAFRAAADPKRFPEQLKYGVQPWQVKRVLWNTFVFGSMNTTSEDQLKIDVGAYNAVLGKGYGEIAAESRTQHKSQGAALVKTRGRAIEYFSALEGGLPAGDIMEGVNTGWSRIEGGEKIQPLVDKLLQSYEIGKPEKLVPGLVELYQAIAGLPDGYWKSEKQKEVRELVGICSGIWLEAVVDHPYLPRGDSVRVTINLINRSNIPARIDSLIINGADTLLGLDLEYNRNYQFYRQVSIAPSHPVTQPYWLVEEMSPGSYNVHDQMLIGRPQGDPALIAEFRLRINGVPFSFSQPVQYKKYDRLMGDTYQPVAIVPRVTGQIVPRLMLFTDGESKSFEVDTRVFGTAPGKLQFSFLHASELGIRPESGFHGTQFTYLSKPSLVAPHILTSYLQIERNGKADSVWEMRTISYEHIPRIDYFRPAGARFVIADLKISGKRIGYVEGAGDLVPQALEQMGYEVTMLKEKDISPAVLKPFDAVFLGVRAYNVHPGLADKYDVLMDYVHEGGNLIMQYNQNDQDMARVKTGPYPFRISSARVTDEHATVHFLQPSHPVLNFPNKITQMDFDGWVQERGIYFADQLDTAYQSIFSMHDPGEPDHNGSLVIADYGRGKFVYTGLVFFRELPAGVPGAFRLLANIIALNHKRGF